MRILSFFSRKAQSLSISEDLIALRKSVMDLQQKIDATNQHREHIFAEDNFISASWENGRLVVYSKN